MPQHAQANQSRLAQFYPLGCYKKASLEAPIYLAMLFIPHLREQPTAAIINVTSGLSFVPIYSATKAAKPG